MARKLVLAVLLLFLTASVFALCETTPDKIKRIDLSYNILSDGSADATFVLLVDYSESCLIEQFKDSIDRNLDSNFQIVEISSDQVYCPKEFILNNVKTELGNFPDGLNCISTFGNDKNTVRMNLTGKATSFAKKVDLNGESAYELTLGGTGFMASLPNDSSLVIQLPNNAYFVNHSPLEGSTKQPTKLTWAPVPSEKVLVNYAQEGSILIAQPIVQQKDDTNYLLILMMVILVLFVLVIINVRSKRASIPIAEQSLEAQLKDVKDKIKNLEQMYMKRMIDETTYRHLNEQYQVQLNEVVVKIKKQNESKNPANPTPSKTE